MDNCNSGTDDDLPLVKEGCDTVNVPVIGSLNGVTSGGWTRYAKKIESAGAWALEPDMFYMKALTSCTGPHV